ncbi:MAG: glycerophosphodiester phosphodiesterase [Labilithrix sp.]|nr:glycerophosphodiester phosphodiesterase [Labilithrix sp.]
MIVLGHRGGRGAGWPPENSLEAFQRALDEGAAGVELDVRLCASGEPVVVHDPSLARLTGGADARAVHAVRRADLPRLAGGVVVPDLEAALDLLRGRIVNVEVKADVPARAPLVRAVARALTRVPGAEVVVSSFDPSIVLALALIAPRVPRAMLVGARTPRLAVALPLALRRAIEAAHLDDAVLTAPRAARLGRAGLRVVGWTVNDPVRARALAELGVAWLITDEPARVLAATAPLSRT